MRRREKFFHDVVADLIKLLVTREARLLAKFCEEKRKEKKNLEENLSAARQSFVCELKERRRLC